MFVQISISLRREDIIKKWRHHALLVRECTNKQHVLEHSIGFFSPDELESDIWTMNTLDSWPLTLCSVEGEWGPVPMRWILLEAVQTMSLMFQAGRRTDSSVSFSPGDLLQVRIGYDTADLLCILAGYLCISLKPRLPFQILSCSLSPKLRDKIWNRKSGFEAIFV